VRETVIWTDPVYVFVDDEGEPAVWGEGEEVNLSVFGDFWKARREPGGRTRTIRALARNDLAEVLRGPWSDISELYYHPSADSYGISTETFMETVEQEEY
jgi:hypothetical protein